MRIVCDVDGVILDIAKYFSTWYNYKYKGNLLANPDSWRFGFTSKDSRVYFDEFFEEHGPHLYDYMYPDVEEYFNKISAENEVWIVTAFPERLSKDRIRNLDRLNYHKLLFEPHKQDVILNDLKPDACIEDKPELLKLFSENNIETYFPGDRNYIKREIKNYGTPFHSWRELNSLIH